MLHVGQGPQITPQGRSAALSAFVHVRPALLGGRPRMGNKDRGGLDAHLLRLDDRRIRWRALGALSSALVAARSEGCKASGAGLGGGLGFGERFNSAAHRADTSRALSWVIFRTDLGVGNRADNLPTSRCPGAPLRVGLVPKACYKAGPGLIPRPLLCPAPLGLSARLHSC